MAKPILRVVNNDLEMLTERAEKLAAECRLLIQFDSIGQRVAHYLEYGRVLLAIRKLLPNKNEFGDYVKEHDLDLHSGSARTDAMWLAENWSDLQATIDQCNFSHPVEIRQWYGEQTGVRKPKKRSADKSPFKLEEDLVENTSIEPESADTSIEAFRTEFRILFESLGYASVSVNKLQIILKENPNHYANYKPEEISRVFNLWNRLVKQMERIKR